MELGGGGSSGGGGMGVSRESLYNEARKWVWSEQVRFLMNIVFLWKILFQICMETIFSMRVIVKF